MSRTKRALAAAAATAVLPLMVALASPAGASAAQNGTLPYGQTSCGASKFLVGSRAMNGGTATIWGSTACGTNWMEWSGPAYPTTKEVHTATVWPASEFDELRWAYSKQVYAPGATPIDGSIRISWGNTAYTYSLWTVHCAATCSWHLETAS